MRNPVRRHTLAILALALLALAIWGVDAFVLKYRLTYTPEPGAPAPADR